MISINGENFFEDEMEEEKNRQDLLVLNSQLQILNLTRFGIKNVQAIIDPVYNENPRFSLHLICHYKNGRTRNFTMISEENLRLALERKIRQETNLLLPSQFPLILARFLTPEGIEHCLATWLNNEAFAARELHANVDIYDLYRFGVEDASL